MQTDYTIVELDTQIASLERTLKAAEDNADRQNRQMCDAKSINELILSIRNRLRNAKKGRETIRDREINKTGTPRKSIQISSNETLSLNSLP